MDTGHLNFIVNVVTIMLSEISFVTAGSSTLVTCYTCQDLSDSCVYNVTSLPGSSSLLCDTRYRECYVFLQQYAGSKGTSEINSFSRGCEVKDYHRNGCFLDAHFYTCKSTCTEQHCNHGNLLHGHSLALDKFKMATSKSSGANNLKKKEQAFDSTVRDGQTKNVRRKEKENFEQRNVIIRKKGKLFSMTKSSINSGASTFCRALGVCFSLVLLSSVLLSVV